MTDMNDLSENLGRIAESNERSAESLLQIQRMIFALVVLVIIITLINIGFLILMQSGGVSNIYYPPLMIAEYTSKMCTMCVCDFEGFT